MLFSAFEFYQTGLASHVRAENLSVSHIPRIEFLLPAVRNTSVSTAAGLGDDRLDVRQDSRSGNGTSCNRVVSGWRWMKTWDKYFLRIAKGIGQTIVQKSESSDMRRAKHME